MRSTLPCGSVWRVNYGIRITGNRGVGIPDVDKAKQPMFTTGGSDRSGMGFTIMESFMTSLTITSEPGKGTTVHMRRKLQKRR